ncbi:transposase [bacterium]|nr:transposase [bacterium]MBU1752901.1 transposase [bacterium]
MRYDLDNHRHSIRLAGYDYSQTGAYFVTICVNSRECLFGEIISGQMRMNEFGETVQTIWNRLEERFTNITTDQFIIMPNHVHGIIVINQSVVGAIHELPLPDKNQRRCMLLPKIVGYFKMNTAKRINDFQKTPGVSVWQRNYYEHIIRNERELNKIREYIMYNPLKWELDFENPSSKKEYKNFTEYLEENITQGLLAPNRPDSRGNS